MFLHGLALPSPQVTHIDVLIIIPEITEPSLFLTKGITDSGARYRTGSVD